MMPQKKLRDTSAYIEGHQPFIHRDKVNVPNDTGAQIIEFPKERWKSSQAWEIVYISVPLPHMLNTFATYYYNIHELQKYVFFVPESPQKYHIDENLDNIRKIGVLIPQQNQVYNYLFHHPDMINVSLHICKATEEKFRNQAQLSLELYQDPEIKDEYLTLYIRQKEYNENIMDDIKEVRTSCERLLAEKNGWLLITTDFMIPK